MAKQFDYQAILDTYRKLQEQANQANEQRYQDILQTIGQTREQVGGTYDQVLGLVESLGQSEGQRIEQGRVRAQASTEQDLINRGLGNTTIRATASRGVEEDAQRMRNELTEQMARQQAAVLQSRAGAEERQGNFLASMMEARHDQGPDLGMFAQLLQQAGAGAAGSEQQTIFTGMSANARAGRDAFGNPYYYTAGGAGGGSAAGGAGSSGGGFAGTSGGGGSGGGAYVIRGAAQQAGQNLGASILQSAASQGGQSPAGAGTSHIFGYGGATPGGVELVNEQGDLDLGRLSQVGIENSGEVVPAGGTGGASDSQQSSQQNEQAVQDCVNRELAKAGDFCFDKCRKNIIARCRGAA